MTSTLVQQLEQGFEAVPKGKVEPKTLAEFVSNHLMNNGLPRLSPELFKLTRNVDLTLTPEQIKKVDKHYKLRAGNNSTNPKREFTAKIPRFTLANVPNQKEVVFQAVGRAIYEEDFRFKTEQGRLRISARGDTGIHWGQEGYDHYERPTKSSGLIELECKLKWTSGFKMSVGVKVPAVPKSFISLGDDAIAEYYCALRAAPRKLREKTTLVSPNLEVLWAPTNKSLYVTGTIPTPAPKIRPLPRGDPALILDIPDQCRSYKHVVAVWDIGEEIPFRNWLAEYSEGTDRRR